MGSWEPTGLTYVQARIQQGVRASPGGRVVMLKAAAALKVGDVVFISGDLAVNKSTTASDYQKRCGVVVGGKLTFNAAIDGHDIITGVASGDVGANAAATNDDVLVQVNGIAYVVADAAISAGVALVASLTTAGRVHSAAVITATVAVGSLVIAAGATPVTSTAANGAIITGSGTGTIAGVGFSSIIGHILEAASAGGDVRRALLLSA